MVALISSLPLVLAAVALGVIAPGLALRVEMTHRAERRLADALRALEVATRLVSDQASTIDAYRALVALDDSFALAPLSPSPHRWTQLALASRGRDLCLTR